MILPVAFVIGLVALVAAEQMGAVLPGSGSSVAMLTWSLAMATPALLAAFSRQALRRALARGRHPGLGVRLPLRLLPGAVPVVYFLLLTEGTWLDLADGLGGGSDTARVGWLLLPLWCLELLRLIGESAVHRRLRTAGLTDGDGLLRERLAMLLLVSIPMLLYGVASDVLAQGRGLEVLFHASATGTIVGLGVFLLAMSVLMPLVFRVLFRVSAALPWTVADELRATARAMGFAPRQVLEMRTDHRLVNAALVGPLPWPRYLVLTDGLLAALDTTALRGVVAHEIGHARARHPALLLLLFVVVPALLLPLLELLGAGELAPLGGLALAAGVAGLGLATLRLVGHRFEHEADIASVRVLGASPCVSALRRVGEITGQDPRRGGLLHPSELRRIECMVRWETEPEYRARFQASGRRLRTGIVAAVVLAAVVGSWSCWRLWPVERAAVALYRGDVPAAQAAAAAVGTAVPSGQWEPWLRLQEEIEAAAAIAPAGGPWSDVAPRLAEMGWQRGLEVLRQEGPVAARRWFALAIVGDAPSAVRRCLYLYCQAEHEGDHERADRIRRHLLGLDLPPDVRPALGA